MKDRIHLIALVALLAVTGRAVELKPGATEVVIAPDAPKTVRFAADEMTNFLAQAFGRAVPLVTAPTAGCAGIHLGSNDWTRAAGIDTSALKRDAFSVVTRGNGVYIAGRDDPEHDLRHSIFSHSSGVWALLYEHATLFGVYEFLERYAGVRMYFPGELGTIVPKVSALRVPTDAFTVTPDYSARNYSWAADGVWYEGEDRDKPLLPARKLNYVRNRMQTLWIPCCHGSNGFRIQRRFAKEHPEYMMLFRKGKELVRDVDPDEKSHHPGQLCHSSAVYDEFFKDICSYARGEDASVRGMGSWRPGAPQDWAIMTFRKPWVDIMPQDGMPRCQCEKCRSAYTANEFDYATELIWRRTAELANRVKEACPGIRICQMAYTPYRRIPDFALPDNIDVMVAEGGPWSVGDAVSMKRQYDEIAGWAGKLGHPVWIWTYPNKYGKMSMPNVPNGTPRAWARYFKGASKWIFGAYAESECDRSFYNLLCYYVFGRVCWNTAVDVDGVLEEHFRLMFGPAAKEMAALSDDVERLWLERVAGRAVETDLGPVRIMPSAYDLYLRIYTRETLVRWKGWLDAAAAKLPEGSLEAKRVGLYRREMFLPLLTAARDYRESISVPRELAERAAHPERGNLLVNGDFSQTGTCGSNRHFGIWKDGKGHDWQGGWIAGTDDGPQIGFHDDVPKGAKGKAMKIVGNGKVIGVSNYFTQSNGHLKPGARYRISFFVRLQDIVPTKADGGVCMRVWCDHNSFFPANPLTGTTDWIHQSFEFVAGPKSSACQNEYMVYCRNATGTVEYADLRLEELTR